MSKHQPAQRLAEFLPYQLSIASNAVSTRIAEQYRKRFALKTTEWRIMAVLGDHGALTQRKLSQQTLMDKVPGTSATFYNNPQYANAVGTPRKLDEQTVEFKLERPNPIFLQHIDLLWIMSKAWCEKNRVTRPLEKLLWEIPGVEYLYSTSSPGSAMVVVRFLVGQDEERALVRLNQKLAGSAGELPPAASAPLVKARSIDDVPVMALTLWGPGYDDLRLRQLAGQLRDAIKEVPDISEVTLIGGRPRQVSVDLDPATLDARGLDLLGVWRAMRGANVRQAAGQLTGRGQAQTLEAGSWPSSAAELGRTVVGLSGGAPVHLGDIATITDAGGEPDARVRQLGHVERRERDAAVAALAEQVDENLGAIAIGAVEEVLGEFEHH